MDGGEVEKGGVGEVLLNRSAARNLYTYFGTKADLTDSTNAFKTANALITPATLGLGSDSSDRDKLIQFVHGYDSYDENGNGVTTEKRDWIRALLSTPGPTWSITHRETSSMPVRMTG